MEFHEIQHFNTEISASKIWGFQKQNHVLQDVHWRWHNVQFILNDIFAGIKQAPWWTTMILIAIRRIQTKNDQSLQMMFLSKAGVCSCSIC